MIGQAIGLLQNSFNQAWVPWAFQKLKGGSENDKSRMVKITYYYLIGILLLVFFLWLMLPIIYTYFIGDRFSEGMQLVLWIALGFAFNGMYKMVSVYIYYLEKTFIIAMTSFGVAIVNVILNFMFIPKYGLQGAAVATMIAMGLQFIVTWGVSSRLIDMPWFWKRK
jgi:O-antigen/teichoic acid export membrane protein